MSINLAKDILTGNCVKPNIFLCEVDKSIICKLETTNTKTSLKFNSYSEISFEVARIYNDLITGETKIFPFYDKIEALRLIKIDGVGYFEIQSAEINSDGIKESKSVTAYSLEYTLSQKYLEDLYNDGTIGSIDSNYIDDVYGGDLSGKEYPVITLYNPNNQKLSLLHIILEKAYGWTIGHVDTSLQTKSRQFNIDRTSIYDFIMNDICEMFNCYVVFDTVNNEINLYAEALTQTIKVTDDNITEFTLNPIYQQVKTVSNNGYKIIIDDIENKYNPSTGVLTLAKAPTKGDTLEVISEDMTPWETDVLVSFDNLSQEVSVNYNADDIKTVLTVEYGEGQNIREVNLGLPYITDLSYYNTEDWMGKELHDVYEEYNEDCNAKKKDYTDRVERRLEYAADLDYEENRVSLNYSVVRNVDSSTTTDETKGEVYYIRTGDAPNYTYVEKTLPGEYKDGTTYYRIGSSDLTEDKIVDFRKALGHYFKEDSMEELDKLVEAETFDFTQDNTLPFGDKTYKEGTLLHILNKHKSLGAFIPTNEEKDTRNPEEMYENMVIYGDAATERDTAIKNFLHEILDQFGLNMLNVVRDMYIKAQDGFIGGWNAADKANEDTSNNENKELTQDQINAIKKEIQDSAEDYPEYYPIVLILEVLDSEIGTSIYSDPPSSTSTGRYADYTDKDGNIHLGIDNLTTEINKLIDENAEISNGLVLDNWFFNYYYKPLEDAFKEENNKDENYELTAEERMLLEDQAKHLSNALLARLNPFLREDELTLEDIVSTELDGISESLSVQNDALSAAYLELQKLSQPQLSFSMTMANIFALPEFEPIIGQFKLGNLIKVAIRPDYIKQSRLLQIDMGLDDFSDFSCEFGELTNLSSQSDIHADLLSNAASAGKQVATYSSYWTQGADTASTTDLKIQQGLLDATTKIKAIDGTQGVTIDKYGIKLQKIDPTTNAVDDKQAWFVNNSLLFTSDGWKTSRAGIGEFTADGRDFYGVIAEAIYSGYIEGTTIAGGKLYSTNYNPDPEKAAGTYINLETGDFEIGGKKLVYDSTDNKLTLDDVTINWNTSNAPGISDIEDLEDSITDFSKGISDNQTKLNNLDSSMAKYLGLSGNTIIGSNYVISPYIGGGYLHIVNGTTSATIDPGNKKGTGYIFRIAHNNQTKVGIDNSGNAEFTGAVTAKSGYIGGTSNTNGWKIETGYITTQYAGLHTSLKTNNTVFLSIGCDDPVNALHANAKIGHDGSVWFGRYNNGTASNPSYLYSLKVTVAGTHHDDPEDRTETRITMRGPVYTEAALFKQRIYLDNYTSLRGKNAGTTHTTNYDTNVANSQCIAYVSTSNNVIFGSSSNTAKTYIQSGDGIVLDSDTIVGGKLMLSSTKYLAYLDSGNIILGRHDNTNSIFIRSKNYIYLACNGSTLSESRYVFQICEYTNTASGNNDNQKSRGTFRPSRKTSEQYLSDLGSPNYKWNTVYAQNTVISSDKRSKENIENINEKYIEVFDLLQPVSYNFKERSRTHLGFISQDVENALNQLGMTAKDFAGFCRDIKTEKDKDGNEVTVVDENGNVDYIYGLNYTEFIALNTAKIKQLEQRLNQAIDIIDKQQEIIEELKNKVL